MELDAIILKAHNQVLEARNVAYLVDSREFQDTWGFSNLQERNVLNNYSNLTVKKLRLWMGAVRRSHISILKTRELKSFARALHIFNYSRLTREELQYRIWEHYEKREDRASD